MAIIHWWSFKICANTKSHNTYLYRYIRTVQGRRNVWGHKDWSSPCFQDSVNPISTRGADYAHHSTTVLTMLKYDPAALRTIVLYSRLTDFWRLSYFLSKIVSLSWKLDIRYCRIEHSCVCLIQWNHWPRGYKKVISSECPKNRKR